MSQEQYNFLDELGLGKVIDNVKTMFAKLSHSHKLSDISDYTVDSAMSSTSTNPVQNKVINSALSGKVPTSRTINGKKLSSNITLSASDVGAATSSDVLSAKNEVQTNLDTHIDNADIHFSATERIKLSGIATGAEANVQSDWNVTDTTSDAYIKNKPSGAGTNLGLVKSGGDVTISNGVITVKDDSHNHVISNIDNLQSSLDAKVPTSRTVNGKSLSEDITLGASDVGAATPTQVNTVQTNLNTHISDESVHFTETERAKLSGIAEGAQKNTVTGVKGSSESTYRTGNINITKANIGLSNVNNTSDANKPVSTAQQAALDGHNTNASAHNDIRLLIEDLNTKLMNFLDLGTDESTGKEVIDSVSELVGLYEENADLINSITTSKVNVSDIIDNLTTASTSKVLSANQGVEIKKLIDALQTAVNGKSDSGHTHDSRYYTESEVDTKLSSKANTSHGNHVPTTETANNAKFLRNDNTWQTVTPENIGAAKSSHGTHVNFSTTAPVMDGTANVGSASTVARSDHKHPTDSSRASKTEFDTHTSDTTKHITSTERTSWNSAKTHADSAHAPSNAQANQNAFSNIKVGDTTISADTTTDTLTLVGSNVTITPDTTNDKVTIAVASGSTSTKGIVQLTNSTSSTSTTTAATPNSVKSAYDLANTAKTNAATAQTKADSAYTLAESKVESLSDLGITATAKELNYVDGVTSNIQTQLDNKANSSHNHIYYGVCSTAADTVAKTVTIDNFSLETGAMVIVKFSNANSVASPTLNINGTGAKPICRYGTTAASTGTSTTGWRDGAVQIFVYDGTSWIRDFWENSTYSNASLGQGYATCSTDASTTAKTASLSSYSLTANGIVSVKFTNAVPASATLNINSKGAKSIYYRGVAITANVIKAGDIATFIYNSQYHLIAIDRWQTDIDSKQTAITGGASTITSSNLTANRALISDSSGKVAVSAVTSTELGYLDGVTSNIQTQLDGKSGTSHTHNYAGSSSAGGSANSAVKLTTSAGSATKPVYFSDGKPVACTYELKKTVPSDAVFTDTKYTHPTSSGNKHIPSGGSSGQILRWSANGTAVWGNDKAIYKKKLITLPTTGWVGDYAPYTINISIDGVLENSDVQITPMLEMTLEQLDAWENLRLYAGKTYDGYITLKANGFKPNVEIPLEVLIGAEIVE